MILADMRQGFCSCSFPLPGLDNAVFRDEAQFYQPCRDGANLALMGGGHAHNRFTRPEFGPELIVLVGSPRSAMTKRCPIDLLGWDPEPTA